MMIDNTDYSKPSAELAKTDLLQLKTRTVEMLEREGIESGVGIYRFVDSLIESKTDEVKNNWNLSKEDLKQVYEYASKLRVEMIKKFDIAPAGVNG